MNQYIMGAMGKGDQKVKTKNCKVSNFWGLIYSMVIIVSNTAEYIWKLLKDQIMKVLFKEVLIKKINL